MASSRYDYIIVGGGLTGCVVAHRLREKDHSVLLVEAGTDPSNNERFPTLLGGFSLLGTELDYQYKTTPQKSTYDRVHLINGGRALGGGTTINFGGWLRGDSNDYDVWAEQVKDERWSYKGLLPWFRKTETFYNAVGNPEAHGFDGPVKVTSISGSDPARKYPLREPVRQAWSELGVEFNADNDGGSVAGLAEFHENSERGGRQASFQSYPLDGVDVLLNAVASKITFTDGVATGVELNDGRQFRAQKEVVIAAGSVRTPQLLMLSGIGPAATLQKHGITVVHDSPAVGQNLHDHFAIYLAFRLKDPERSGGLAMGKLKNPAFFKGLPVDWVVNELEKPKEVAEAIEQEARSSVFAKSLKTHPRPLVESFTFYAPGGVPGVPADGSHIASSVMLLTPTSRGSVSIASTSIGDHPVIDSQYATTEVDRRGLVHSVRRTVTAMTATKALGEYVESETPPSGDDDLVKNLKPLTAETSDEDILDRILRNGKQHHHSGGTAAMGKVVDVEGKVFGVKGLRVVDGSILPNPIAGHPQATLYLMAEQLASMILESS